MPDIDGTLTTLSALDELYETMTLNAVSRRASRTQGVALLSLYSKGFAKPRPSQVTAFDTSLALEVEPAAPDEPDVDCVLGRFVDQLKLAIRREDTHGHLPICWGVLTAALGLSLGATALFSHWEHHSDIVYSERTQFLHLFLCARGMLSASVRMNIIGPYAAQQLLLHTIRPIVDTETARCAHLRTGVITSRSDDDNLVATQDAQVLDGPAMTWPLGEILAARHDLQHSRIFNS